MRPPAVSTLSARAPWSIQPTIPTPSSIHGRTAAYRRLSTAPLVLKSWATPQRLYSAHHSQLSPFLFLRSDFLPRDILFRSTSAHTRHFSSCPTLLQQAQKHPEPDIKEAEPRPQSESKQSTTSGGAAAETPGDQDKEGEAGKRKEGGEESGEKEGADGKEKADKPPPPPHGDKTPWQVFTETLKTEFQASKEWNDSTKQLSAGVNDFTQNPRVQKAKNTYSQVTDAASTKTAEALKTTATAIGTGAAWTWDTAPVKGVRKVANVTGTGLEYVTRPVRESKAFKAVKETVDDGSSSRYGGWIEKEERRKRRELRELNELQRMGGKPLEPMEENPE
jgi:import inner membrane translocase subunit TIM44